MAVDKLIDSAQLDTDLTSVANAIRAKSGGSGQLSFPAGFASEIGNISGGGSENPELTPLSDINLTSAVRSVAVSLPADYSAYDYLIVKLNLELSSGDYVYFSSASTSGGVYTPSNTTSLTNAMIVIRSGSTWYFYNTYVASNANQSRGSVSSGGSMYIYTYTASKNFKSGGTVSVYGGKYADL